MEIEMTIILLLALAAFLVFVAWKNDWDVKAVIAAFGAAAVAAWEALSGGGM